MKPQWLEVPAADPVLCPWWWLPECGQRRPPWGAIQRLDPVTDARLDGKHGLDVALSRGRHAAERAALHGSQLALLCLDHPPAACPPASRSDPYRYLLARADPVLAAAVGAALAAAQIALPLLLTGRGAVEVLTLVTALQPATAAWLHAPSASAPVPVAIRRRWDRRSHRPEPAPPAVTACSDFTM